MAWSDPAASATAERTAELAPGRRVGRYVVIARVGSGGLGDVYAAYDPQLDRKVALKLLRSDPELRRQLGDPQARLLREAQAMARVRHPNAVAVHDVGTVDDVGAAEPPGVFVAMEFVAGTTLAGWLRERPRDWRAIRDVFVQAGRALAAIHRAGIVHRDFKLSNLMIEPEGRVVVLDFGLAKAFAAERLELPDGAGASSSATSLLAHDMTRIGVIAGTPPYMAPEQFAGQVVPASDQFAFCAALHYALHGSFPFSGDSVEARLRAIERGLPAVAAGRIPAWLHAGIARGLAPRPSDRFADMDALLAVLRTDERRRRRWMIAAALMLPLVGAAAVAVPWALRPVPTAAEIDRVQALVGEARAAASRGYYVHPPVDAPEGPTAYRKIVELEREVDVLGPAAEDEARALRAEMSATLTRLGDEYQAKEGGAPFAADFYAAALVFEPGNKAAAERSAVTAGEIAILREKAASGGFSPGELEAAEPLVVLADDDAGSRRDKLRTLYRRPRGPSAGTRARLQRVLPPAEQAIADAGEREALGATPTAAPTPVAADVRPAAVGPVNAGGERAPGTSDAAVVAAGTTSARGETAAATAAMRAGDLDGAEAHFHRALRVDRNHAAALFGLAELHYERGQYEKAAKLAERAVAVAPRNAAYHMLLGDASFKVLAYDAARAAYRRARALGARAAGDRLARIDALVGP